MNWHALPAAEVFKILESSEKGLSLEEAQNRLKKLGLNEIPEKNGVFLQILLNQFRNPLIYILIAAGAVSFLLEDYLDFAIIFGAVILNASVGLAQEWKASNVLRELKKFLSYKTTVIRGGKTRHINSKELVIGDLIVLRQGDRISADARLIKTSNFKTNEAIFTGESSPAVKAADILAEKTLLADRNNMVFSGTFAEEGFAEAVVVATGEQTEFGKISALAKKERMTDVTPLQIKLKTLAKTLAVVFLSISAGLFLLGVLTGRDILSMFLTAVAVAVAAVPESLPVVLTVTLAVGARRILEKGGLVRKIIAAEALGSTTVIAADKTGTLTEGKMTIHKLITEKEENFILRLLALITNAVLENPHEASERWRISGRPIDRAILLSVAKNGLNKEALLEEMPRLDELPFNARYKYSTVLNRLNNDQNIIVTLGAPEALLRLTNFIPPEIEQKINVLTGEGFRVLALGYKETPASLVSLNHSQIIDLKFAALVIFSDPIREEVKEAIALARRAGIRTIMITGDHFLTAQFVAKELQLLTADNRIIEGKDLPDKLDKVITNYDVFARISPEDKVKIVVAFQRQKENVAVIGDGVNDVPALLQADIGVAVGSGTDVAKEASDLVLLNDSFAIIVEAIRRGRIILNNIKKSIIFLISGAFSEIILVAGSILLNLPLAILPAQILWVNLIEDGLPAIALAFEKEAGDVMKSRPRIIGEVFTREMKFLIASFSVVTDLALFIMYYYLLQSTGDIEYSRTMIFVALGLTSLFYIYSVRSLDKPFWKIDFFSNRILNIAVVVGVILYLAAIYFQPLNYLLGTTMLAGKDWLILTGLGLFNILVIEISKAIFLKRRTH